MRFYASLLASAAFLLVSGVLADELSFKEEIVPLMQDYCYDCHGDGSAKGEFSMDEYDDLSAHLGDIEHWLAVWQNVRSQIMPPPKKDQLGLEEKRKLLGWIEKEVFKLDPNNPDPGRVTIRRLNRVEYHYAVKDLLGVDYRTWENFPADDTGYGFDTIGDVLTISPLHMEKYLEAAAVIMERALPKEASAQISERDYEGKRFRDAGKNKHRADRLEFAVAREVFLEIETPAKGPYQVNLDYQVRGSDEATDQTATIQLWHGEKRISERMIGWDQRESIRLSGKANLGKGKSRLTVKILPDNPAGDGQGTQFAALKKVLVKGPMDGSYKEYPKGYQMIMVDGPAPKDSAKRKAYAQKIMRSFVSRAFRRPLDRGTIRRLVSMAMEEDQRPGRSFVDGIRHSMTAVLASPRFLFRAEVQPEPNNQGKIVQLDEYALASRLSFFLWSSVPDDELLSLAFEKKLRANLRPQVERMLADWKSERFVKNFVGQWMQARDIEGMQIEVKRVLESRDQKNADRIFSGDLRSDMRKETELFFDFVLKNDRPAEELISARYSFLNERLAGFYGVKGVKGDQHRLIDLHEYPHRGGLLTQGTFLVVTSNPTRTSPVKRGLFVLDNILGTPAPPAPPDVPELEEVAHNAGKQLTMREMMEIHREKKICASCHQRMDPIGLGLENFNAIGQFRAKEKGLPIDSGGKLITGEEFTDVVGLKEILANDRRDDFYRCLSEKILTYAIGRGPEYYDAATLNLLVERLKKKDGHLKELVIGIIESAPFQKRRGG